MNKILIMLVLLFSFNLQAKNNDFWVVHINKDFGHINTEETNYLQSKIFYSKEVLLMEINKIINIKNYDYKFVEKIYNHSDGEEITRYINNADTSNYLDLKISTEEAENLEYTNKYMPYADIEKINENYVYNLFLQRIEQNTNEYKNIKIEEITRINTYNNIEIIYNISFTRKYIDYLGEYQEFEDVYTYKFYNNDIRPDFEIYKFNNKEQSKEYIFETINGRFYSNEICQEESSYASDNPNSSNEFFGDSNNLIINYRSKFFNNQLYCLLKDYKGNIVEENVIHIDGFNIKYIPKKEKDIDMLVFYNSSLDLSHVKSITKESYEKTNLSLEASEIKDYQLKIIDYVPIKITDEDNNENTNEDTIERFLKDLSSDKEGDFKPLREYLNTTKADVFAYITTDNSGAMGQVNNVGHNFNYLGRKFHKGSTHAGMSIAENLSGIKDEFTYTFAHEFGHLLNIQHTNKVHISNRLIHPLGKLIEGEILDMTNSIDSLKYDLRHIDFFGNIGNFSSYANGFSKGQDFWLSSRINFLEE
jgi:hypothetical protein